MLAAFPVARRHVSAIRRFPPGCGRHHYAAQPPQHPNPSAANLLLPNPSAWTATKTTSYPPRQPLPAAAFPGTEGHDRCEGNGSVAEIKVLTAAAVTARRPSAVRRYPPGCGRGVAVSKPGALVGEGDTDASNVCSAGAS